MVSWRLHLNEFVFFWFIVKCNVLLYTNYVTARCMCKESKRLRPHSHKFHQICQICQMFKADVANCMLLLYYVASSFLKYGNPGPCAGGDTLSHSVGHVLYSSVCTIKISVLFYFPSTVVFSQLSALSSVLWSDSLCSSVSDRAFGCVEMFSV